MIAAADDHAADEARAATRDAGEMFGYTLECPYCHAPRNQFCRTSAGNVARRRHKDRVHVEGVFGLIAKIAILTTIVERRNTAAIIKECGDAFRDSIAAALGKGVSL